MNELDQNVTYYMSKPVFTIGADASLDEARRRINQHRVSSLVVSDGGNSVAGVISSTDLLASGLFDDHHWEQDGELDLPDKKVREIMKSPIISVSPSDKVREAAARMIAGRVHRVYVIGGERAVGVLSTKDLTRIIAEARIRDAVEGYMTSPVKVISHDTHVSDAGQILRDSGVSALVVVGEELWPVGFFSRFEALRARGVAHDAPVEDVMNTRVVSVRASTAVYRAAALVASMRARRVVVVEDNQAVGILSGLDFARAAK